MGQTQKVPASKTVRRSVLRIKRARKITSLERRSLVLMAESEGLSKERSVRFTIKGLTAAEVVLVPRVRIFK